MLKIAAHCVYAACSLLGMLRSILDKLLRAATSAKQGPSCPLHALAPFAADPRCQCACKQPRQAKPCPEAFPTCTGAVLCRVRSLPVLLHKHLWLDRRQQRRRRLLADMPRVRRLARKHLVVLCERRPLKQLSHAPVGAPAISPRIARLQPAVPHVDFCGLALYLLRNSSSRAFSGEWQLTEPGTH